MTLRNGFPAVSDAADQFDIRAALRATTAQDANGNIKTGVSITAKSLTGLVTAGNGMNSDIAAFDAVTNRYGPVWLSNDGTISVKHAAAPSANSRIDLICIKQNETAAPASDPTDGPEAIIVTGTPAVDPVTPATPEGALALARVTIPSTATSMTSTGVIYEQMYPFTASAGADLLFRSETEKDAWTPWEGQKCRLLDGNEYQAKSGVWVSLTPAEYAPYIQCAGHTVTTGDDGTFWVGVKSPNGKPPDYASYTVGPFGTGFNDEDGIIAHLWDVTATGVRFRLYTTRYQRWCGKTAIFGKWITVWRR